MKRFYLLTKLTEGSEATIVKLNSDIPIKCSAKLKEGMKITCLRKIGEIGGIYLIEGKKMFIPGRELRWVVCI